MNYTLLIVTVLSSTQTEEWRLVYMG